MTTTLVLGTKKGLLVLDRGASGWRARPIEHAGIHVSYAFRDPQTSDSAHRRTPPPSASFTDTDSLGGWRDTTRPGPSGVSTWAPVAGYVRSDE